MNKPKVVSSGVDRVAPKRSIPTPRIVKPPTDAASAGTQDAATDPTRPLKPANVMKAAQPKKFAPWLTTAKIPKNVVPRIP